MIPDLDDGVLPDGIHDATFDELSATFGRFQRSDRRIRLTDRLRAYLDDARRSGVVAAVIVDGSYVTAKDEPDDIDLIVVIRAAVDVTALRPFEYNAVSRRMIQAAYRFDAHPRVEGTPSYHNMLSFFQDVNRAKDPGLTSRTRKGVVRIVL